MFKIISLKDSLGNSWLLRIPTHLLLLHYIVKYLVPQIVVFKKLVKWTGTQDHSKVVEKVVTGRCEHYLTQTKTYLVSIPHNPQNVWSYAPIIHLLAVWWPGTKSAQDKHLLACNFAIFTDLKIIFTGRLSNKPFLMWFSARPSVLWRCWLGSRKGIQPVKNWVVGCWHGYLSGARCRLAYGPADATSWWQKVKTSLAHYRRTNTTTTVRMQVYTMHCM